MGSTLEFNDTLKLKSLRLKKPFRTGIIYKFDLDDVRIFHPSPVRVFLVEEVDGLWCYHGHAEVLTQEIDAISRRTTGSFRVTKLYSPEYAALVNVNEAPAGKGFTRPRSPELPEGVLRLGARAALEEARRGAAENGIPIGSALVRDGVVLGRGRNRRVQDDDPVLHAEIACLQNAGRVRQFRNTILFSTLMPCHMCAGAIVQFGIPTVVVGESESFRGAEEFLFANGVAVIDLMDDRCKSLMAHFKKSHPRIWREDIGR